MSLPDLLISGPRLSDVFFNYEHPEYDKLFAGDHREAIGGDAIEKAIRLDASEFCLTVGEKDNQELAGALTADFMRRL